MPRLPSFLVAALVLLPGCFEPTRPPVRGMAVTEAAAQKSAFTGAVKVSGVTGGGRRGFFNPHEIEAAEVEKGLTDSLASARILALTPAMARYGVSAEILDVDQPFQTEQEQVTTIIRYVLTDLRSGQQLLVRQVEVPYEARGDSAFRTGDRSRIAGEGSVRESIETFLDLLAEVEVPAAVESAPAEAQPADGPPAG
jgi:hypothetical protein